MRRVERYLREVLTGKLHGQIVEILGSEEHLVQVLSGARILTPYESVQIQALDETLDTDLLIQLSRDDNTDYKRSQKKRPTQERTLKSSKHRSSLPQPPRAF